MNKANLNKAEAKTVGRPFGSRVPRGTHDRPEAEHFVEMLQDHLAELGLTETKLCNMAGIAHSQIGAWKKGIRAVTRRSVNSIAWALAVAYDDAQEKATTRGESLNRYFGRSRLDCLLNELLMAAGFRAVQGRHDDFVWDQIVGATHVGEKHREENSETQRRDPERKIRVGWFPWGAFSREDHEGKFEGPSREILEEICRLLGVTLEPVECSLQRIEEEIRCGNIHITQPLILMGQRLLHFETSMHLGDDNARFRTSVNAIIHSTNHHRIVRDDSLVGLDSIRIKDVRFYYMADTIGPTLVDFLVRGNKDGDVLAKRYETLEHGWRDVLTTKVDADDRYRAFVCDEFTAQFAVSTDANAKRLLAIPPAEFPLVIAAHPQEKTLIRAINSCLEIMTTNKFWDGILEHAPFLRGLRSQLVSE